MRTAFSVAVLMGLTYAQRSYSSGRFNPYGVKPTPDPTPDPDNGGDDNRPEECKDKEDITYVKFTARLKLDPLRTLQMLHASTQAELNAGCSKPAPERFLVEQ